MPTTDAMTEPQARCWRALRAYHAQFGTAPPYSTLGAMLGVSRQRAHQLCGGLRAAGWVRDDAHGRPTPHDLTDDTAPEGA